MLSRYRHKYKTLHSRTKPLAILHEKKMKAITSFVFAQTPLRHYVFFFPIPLEVDTGLIQKSKQNQSPAAGPVQGQGTVFLSHVPFVAIETSCPPSFHEFPSGIVWTDWKTALLLIKAYHFIGSHTFAEPNPPTVPGVLQIIHQSGSS